MKRVKIIEQTTPTECGLCCLCMMLEFNNIYVTLFEMKQRVSVLRNGLSLKNITTLAKDYGVECHSYRYRTDLDSIPFPSMIFINQNHFVILENISRKRYTIVDPAVGRYILNESEFNELAPKYYTTFIKVEESKAVSDRNNNFLLNFKSILSGFSRELLTSILFAAMFQLVVLLLPFFLRSLIDGKLKISSTSIYNILLALLLLVLFQGIFLFSKGLFLVRLQNKIHEKLATSFVSKLLLLSPDSINKLDRTDIIHRYNGVMIVREMVSERVLSMWLDTLIMIVCYVYITSHSTILGSFLMLLLFIESTIFFLTFQSKKEKLSKEVLRQKESLQIFFSLIDSLLLIKTKNVEKIFLSRWYRGLKKYLKSAYERTRYINVLTSITNVITSFAPILVVIIYIYITKEKEEGEVMVLYIMTTNFISPINSMLNSVDEIIYEMSYYNRIKEVELISNEKTGVNKLSRADTIDINLKKVDFKYEFNSKKVLRNIDIEINSGEFIAIIGRSGSGKSSLARLLAGHLEPTSGDILYNGLSYHKLDKKDLRTVSSIVSQEPPILDGDIEFNISLGRTVTDKELKQVCESVAIYNDIMNMPLKFSTPVSKDSHSLSGGQLQRIVLARELITKPRLLILDEPTSALDVHTERIIQSSIENLKCTRILITHRLNTIVKADMIFVMDSGEIVAKGTHQQLYLDSSEYRKAYDSYMNNYKETKNDSNNIK